MSMAALRSAVATAHPERRGTRPRQLPREQFVQHHAEGEHIPRRGGLLPLQHLWRQPCKQAGQ